MSPRLSAGRALRRAIAALVGIGVMASALAAQVASSATARPRLVVVIAVDQLRPDYLDRFRPYFGPRG